MQRTGDGCCEVLRAVSRALRQIEPEERGDSRAGAFAIRRFAVSRLDGTMGIESGAGSENGDPSTVGAGCGVKKEGVFGSRHAARRCSLTVSPSVSSCIDTPVASTLNRSGPLPKIAGVQHRDHEELIWKVDWWSPTRIRSCSAVSQHVMRSVPRRHTGQRRSMADCC